MRWTRAWRQTSAACCGRRSRVVLMPRRRHQALWKYLQGDGDKKARSPGRSRRKPLKPIARGMPDCLWRTCGDYTRMLFYSHTRLWVRGAPGIPCALSDPRGTDFVKLGRISRRENANVCQFRRHSHRSSPRPSPTLCRPSGKGNGPGVFSHELAEMPEGLRVAKEPIFVVVGQLEHARTRRRR